jgi:hypothetical protein
VGEIIGVTGGAAGVAASYAAARELADDFDAAGDRLRDHGRQGLRMMRDPDLLESGLLAPSSCAAAEAAVLAATAGPRGVLPASLGWEVDAVAVRTAISGLEVADDVARVAVVGLDHQLAMVAMGQLALPVVLDPGLLTEHPGLTEHVVDGLGGPAGAGAAALLYGDPGRPVVTPYAANTGGAPPRSIQDLLEHLHAVAALSEGAGSPANGTVEVQTIRGPDGQVRHVVYLPGTDDFNAPWDQDGDVRDLETDLDLMSGRPDPYQQGILEALHQAGVQPGEPVLLVGHSLGGMAAVAILAGDSGYDVTDVVTAGSPTAQVSGFPVGSHVLSLEQQGDLVPELDGAPNPDSVEQTTVVFDAGPDAGVVAHHGYGTYEEGAALADTSTDPSVVEAVGSLHEHGFLGSDDSVTSQVFQITRAP